jgi:hypothetical protein
MTAPGLIFGPGDLARVIGQLGFQPLGLPGGVSENSAQLSLGRPQLVADPARFGLSIRDFAATEERQETWREG